MQQVTVAIIQMECR